MVRRAWPRPHQRPRPVLDRSRRRLQQGPREAPRGLVRLPVSPCVLLLPNRHDAPPPPPPLASAARRLALVAAVQHRVWVIVRPVASKPAASGPCHVMA